MRRSLTIFTNTVLVLIFILLTAHAAKSHAVPPTPRTVKLTPGRIVDISMNQSGADGATILLGDSEDFRAVPKDIAGSAHIFVSEREHVSPGTTSDMIVIPKNSINTEMWFKIIAK